MRSLPIVLASLLLNVVAFAADVVLGPVSGMAWEGSGSNLVATWGPSIAVDMWQDFEFDAITAENLEASDHSAAGAWSVALDQASTGISIGEEKKTISRIGGVTDGGTRGLQQYVTNTVTSYIAWSFSSSTGVSVGCWFRPPYTPTSGHRMVLSCHAGFIEYYQGSGSNSPVIRLGNGGSSVAGSSALVPGAWYWITARFVRNGACTGIVYTASGSQLTTQPAEVTGLDNAITALYIGDAGPSFSHPSYWAMDDLVVDITALKYPLGP